MLWWPLPLTVITFFVARQVAIKLKSPLFNPLLISIAIIIPLLLLTKTPYNDYFAGSSFIHDLLQPAIVALAYPLYLQLHQIRSHWKSILFICFTGSITAVITGVFITLWLGGTETIAASVMPKSITTPLAMAVAESTNGIPAISSACVMFVGILGAVFGHMILDAFRIKNAAARGLAIGSVSHALGTARCAEVSYQEGAYGSLALAICGIITSLLAPLMFPVLLMIYHWL